MNNNKQLIRFLAVSVGLYLAWYFLQQWIGYHNRLDNWLSQNVAQVSAALLSIIGYNTATRATDVLIDGRAMVGIANACNGLVLQALFTGFVLAFPGPVSKKFFYIPAGIMTIYLLNVLRVVALALIALYYPETLDFNHHYTFTFIVYACIFGLWMLWVKKLSGISITHVQSPTTKKQTA